KHDRLILRRRLVDLGALARSVGEQFEPQAQQYGCRIDVEIAHEPLLVEADAWRLERALANLVGNAIKYSRVAGRPERRGPITASGVDGGVAVPVADSGAGMDWAALAAVGEPFTRLESARGTTGMGIGVYLSRGIVAQHGGTLSFASDGPGLGTTVTVWLPSSAQPGARGAISAW